MSQKRRNPFSFLYSSDSEATSTASDGEIPVPSSHSNPKKPKLADFPAHKPSGDVEILKVEPGRNERQVEIIKVERGVPTSPEVQIVKVIPPTSTQSSTKSKSINWPINCRKLQVESCVGKVKESGKKIY